MELAEIGEFVRERRIELRLRQEDLSEMADVNMKTIQQIEMGTGNPAFQTFAKLFKVLGLNFLVEINQPG
ncbi:MAG: helix-turn-helix transcriptional regulator [Phormidesmis sp. FL-bin-119]|nr:helix-turn-helix transcriptional regulator [Pedobacter sp.]